MSSDHNDEGKLDGRAFGLNSLTSLVVASMIGVGVFTTSGFTLGATGSLQSVMLCWTLGGMIAICGAISYGELASLMPESGGEYLFLSRNLHPSAGFLAGWVSLVAGFSGAIATTAVGFVPYALPDHIRPAWLPPDVAAITLIIAFGTMHATSVRLGAAIQNAIVCVKVVALFAFLAVVGLKAGSHDWQIGESSSASLPESVSSIASSLVWISLSFTGFNAASYVAGESKNAAANVPRALVLGTVLVTALYLVLNFVFVAAVPVDEIVWQQPVAAIAAKALGGSNLELLIRIAVSLGLASSISGMIISGPRVYSKMADDNVFPRRFAGTQPGIRRSITLQCTIAVALILVQRVLVFSGLQKDVLLGLFIYLGTTLSISSACCAATLFLPSVRKRLPNGSGWKTVPTVVYVVATFASVIVMAATHTVDGESQVFRHLGGTVITFVTGLIAWRIFRPELQSDAVKGS